MDFLYFLICSLLAAGVETAKLVSNLAKISGDDSKLTKETLKVNDNDYIQQKTKIFRKSTIALSIGGFSIFANMHMTQPLLPMFSKEIGVAPTVASLSISLVTLTISIFLLVFGPISDALGRKNIMGFGLFFSSLISVFIYFVPNFSMLLFLRAAQGIALAALPAVAYAYIGEEFEPTAIGVAIGLYISANSLGGMGGRIISGVIADFFGWRFAFLFMGILGLLSFIPFMLYLPDSKHFHIKHFSVKEALIQFSRHLINPVLRDAYYIAGILFFIFIGLFNYLGYHLHKTPYYLPTSMIGLLYVTYLAGTFSSTLSGRLGRRVSIPRKILIGMLCMLTGMLLLLARPVGLVILGITFVCFGFFFSHAAASSWVSTHAVTAKASASALYLLFYYLGATLGGILLGYVWEYAGWTAVVMSCAILILLALINVWQMSKHEVTSKAF